MMSFILSTTLLAVGADQGLSTRWPADKAWDWYNAHPWIVGFNYVPSSAANTTEFWGKDSFDEKTIERELSWAQELGFNSCRVFLQYLVWKTDPEGMKKRLARLLEIAHDKGISVIPVFFDDCTFGDPVLTEPFMGPQREPIPGMILPSWTPSPGLKEVVDRAAWPGLEAYVKEMVSFFAEDDQILFWDLYNEPGNSNMGDQSLPLMEACFGWARQAHPTQPLTIGLWSGYENLNRAQIDLSDIITFHAYTNDSGLLAAIRQHQTHGRPVICTEWMARLQGSRWETDLPLFQQLSVGCLSWGLVNGRTQAQFPWGSKKGAPEPEIWFHDLMRPDGSPFNPVEIAAIQETLDPQGVPQLKPLFHTPLRDTCICLGAECTYVLSGTTGYPTWWNTNEGIRLWTSKDLHRWEPLGLVWTFERDATWQKEKEGKLAIWAPEIHFFKDTYWIAYCVNTGGTGVLKSTSGKPEGPYVDVKKDGPLTGEIDASLFQDEDGTVYFAYQNGKVARMKDDMSGLAEEPKLLVPANAPHVGFEGAFLFKAHGLYHLSCAEFIQKEYHCMVATSQNLLGPYGDRTLAVRHGGHNMFFRDKSGEWWSTFFGNDENAPFTERPGILPVTFGLDNGIRLR